MQLGNIGNSKVVVYLLSAFAIFLWGFSYIWSNELIYNDIPIYYFVTIRIAIAGCVLLLFNLVTRQFQKIRNTRDFLYFLMLSVCEPFIYFIAETYGIKETASPTISAMVIATVPVFSMIVGFMAFKEKVTGINVAGLVLTLAGLFLVLSTQLGPEVGQNFILGLVLLFVAVISEVCHASLTKHLAATYKPHVIVMYQFLIGSVYFIPLFMTEGIRNFTPFYVSWEVMRPILYLAILCSAIAFALWAYTIKSLGVAKSSIFLAMISVVTALAAHFTGHETLGPLQWTGVAISAVGIIFSQYAGRQKPEPVHIRESEKFDSMYE